MTEALLKITEGWARQALARKQLSEADLRAAQAKAQELNQDLGQVVVQSGLMTEEQIAQLAAEAAGVAYMDVLDYQIDPKVLELVPEAVSRKHTLLPLYRVGNALTMAMTDPWNAVAIDEVRLSTKLPIIQPVVSTASAIRQAIERHYGHKVVEEAAQQRRRPSAAEAPAAAPGRERRRPEAAPIVEPSEPVGEVQIAKLVDALLAEALEARASDIHIEPELERVRVRFRVDGVLQEVKQLPLTLHEALSSRIKLLAKLDITEHRLPQDGSISTTIQNRQIDLRISSYPTILGENLVIRLLDHASLKLDLDVLGFAPDMLTQFRELIQRPHGIVLVTGPTGSGKTTTLYASLSQINSMEKNIMTIEDPVEYHLPLIRQTQINLKAGVTFAAGIRAILRQDPDIIMVGEIRDQETAEIAVHAALTGHLVLSTLHTNDAVGAIARLVDMGMEPFLLASTLLGVMAQRLVRKICPHCQAGSRPSPEQRQRYPDLTVVYQGRGCRLCRKSGYRGRVGIFELFQIDEQARAMVAAKTSTDELRRYALAHGMCNLRGDGLLKVQKGLTTLEELDRVVPA